MVEDLYVTIGNRIKTARIRAGLTQQEVAEKLNMTTAGFGSLERATNQVSIDKLLQIARILNRPLDWFLGLPDEYSQDEKDLVAAYRKADKRTRQMTKILFMD